MKTSLAFVHLLITTNLKPCEHNQFFCTLTYEKVSKEKRIFLPPPLLRLGKYSFVASQKPVPFFLESSSVFGETHVLMNLQNC